MTRQNLPRMTVSLTRTISRWRARWRRWWNSPDGRSWSLTPMDDTNPDGYLPRLSVSHTGNATVTGNGYANTGIDRRPRTARDEADDRMNTGHAVTAPREAINYAENLLIRLLRNDDALHALGVGYDTVRIDACRRALSDAIESADRTQGQGGGNRS